MHRSGTTLVSKILHDAGIFMGVWQDHNAESLPFLSLNQQILAQQGADWLHPAVPERQLPHMPAPRDLYHWHWDIRSRWQRWQAAWRPRPWGWKDPRNTFTLPRWLECYPQARVLVVQREAEDVVRSLQQRNSRAGAVQDDALPVDSPLFAAPIRQSPVALAIIVSVVIVTPAASSLLTIIVIVGLLSEALPLMMTLRRRGGTRADVSTTTEEIPAT